MRGDVGILDGHDAVEHLDHRDLRAHVVVEARELDPDRARSDHQQLRRHLGRRHRVAIGPDALAVGGGEGQVARAAPVATMMFFAASSVFLPSSAVTVRPPFAVSTPLPMCTAILFFFIRCVTPLVELLGDAARALDHCHQVGGDLLRGEAIVLGMLHIVEDLAERSSALVGMHPQLRQMPPSNSRSTIAVLSPSCAPRIAAT